MTGRAAPDVQAKLRAEIKRLLRRYKYPPDKQQGAVTMVLEQMELIAHHGAAEGR